MRLVFALLVGALALPQTALAAPTTTGKKSQKSQKSKKKSKKKSKRDRAVSESAWAAMIDRSVVVVTGDSSVRGTLAGHDANTATVIEDNGDLLVVEKDDVSELRAAQAASPPPPPPTPATNSASPPTPSDAARGLKKGGTYLYGSPGAVLFPFSLDLLAYRWGFGVGSFKPRSSSHFATAVGFAFDHAVAHDRVVFTTIDPLYGLATETDINVFTHIIRSMAEVRLGGSGEKYFAYGLVGAGLTVLQINANEDGGTSASASETDFGICVPFGAGIQGLIGERLIVGFEPRVVFDLTITTVFDAKLLIGTKF